MTSTPPFQLDLSDHKAGVDLLNPDLHHLDVQPLIITVATMALAYGSDGFGKWGWVVAFLLAGQIAAPFWGRHQVKATLKAHFDKSSILNRPMTLRFDDQGIDTLAGKPISWPDIERITETKTHFFALVTNKFGTEGLSVQGALTIPKRIFQSPAQCAEFGALLNRKWAQHHLDAAPIAAPK